MINIKGNIIYLVACSDQITYIFKMFPDQIGQSGEQNSMKIIPELREEY